MVKKQTTSERPTALKVWPHFFITLLLSLLLALLLLFKLPKRFIIIGELIIASYFTTIIVIYTMQKMVAFLDDMN